MYHSTRLIIILQRNIKEMQQRNSLIIRQRIAKEMDLNT